MCIRDRIYRVNVDNFKVARTRGKDEKFNKESDINISSDTRQKINVNVRKKKQNKYNKYGKHEDNDDDESETRVIYLRTPKTNRNTMEESQFNVEEEAPEAVDEDVEPVVESAQESEMKQATFCL